METIAGIFLGSLLAITIGLVWLIPFVLLIRSNRTEGVTKLLWLIVMLCVSWFAWIAYLLLVPRAAPKVNRFNSY